MFERFLRSLLGVGLLAGSTLFGTISTTLETGKISPVFLSTISGNFAVSDVLMLGRLDGPQCLGLSLDGSIENSLLLHDVLGGFLAVARGALNLRHVLCNLLGLAIRGFVKP